MGSWFLHSSNFFVDFDQNTKEVPTKINKKNFFFFVPSKCQKNKGNLVYYRSKLFLCPFFTFFKKIQKLGTSKVTIAKNIQ
jgi:hypothetical protein